MSITKKMVLEWLGKDADKNSLVNILLDIANGEYTSSQLKIDIESY